MSNLGPIYLLPQSHFTGKETKSRELGWLFPEHTALSQPQWGQILSKASLFKALAFCSMAVRSHE